MPDLVRAKRARGGYSNGFYFSEKKTGLRFGSSDTFHEVKSITGRSMKARKFYVERNNNNVDSFETEGIVFADLLP